MLGTAREFVEKVPPPLTYFVVPYPIVGLPVAPGVTTERHGFSRFMNHRSLIDGGEFGGFINRRFIEPPPILTK